MDFLEHAEAVCLLVCAVDARMSKLARFVFAHPHLLLLGDEGKKHASVLHCAAAHGQVAVVQWTLRHRSMRLTRRRGIGGGGSVTGATGVCTTTSVCPFLYTSSDSESPSSKSKLAAMAWVNRNVPYVFPAEVMYEAARQGDAHVVAWLHTTCQYATYRAMEFAATRGHLEIAQWLYDHRDSALQSPPKSEVHMLVPLSTDPDASSKADVMNWTAVFVKGRYFREAFATRDELFGSYDQRDDAFVDWDDPAKRDAHFAHRRFKAIDLAASRGDLELIKKLHADGKQYWPCTAQAMDGAARLGHLHVVQWLHKHRTEGCTSNAIAAAAGNGHFAVVQWLHAHRFEGCRSYAMDLTATHGHLQLLQWLYIEYPRFSCTQACLPCVAANNHRHVLRWLHKEKGFELDVRTVEVAIANGHFELVQWLLKQEPSLSDQLTPLSVARAAKSGNAEMTQWLVSEKRLWSSRALASAAATANLELVQWLYDFASDGNDDKSNDPVDAAVLFDLAHKSEFELIEWLLSHKLGQPRFTQTQKEFAALFGSARQQTSVNGNTSKALTASNSSFFAWDLHTKENPSWIAKYALMVLKYYPNFLLSVNSSPMLSAQRGVTEILQRLAASGHPEVFTKQTFRAMMTYTKAGDAVQWFFKATGFAFMDASVIEWAARFQLSGLLECVMAQMENVDERYRAHACETVMRTACRQGHLDLLRWGLARFESLSAATATANGPDGDTTKVRKYMQLKATLWQELGVDAAANGHLDVLAWIFICSDRPRPGSVTYNQAVHFQQLADAAAENGHVHVLQWVERKAWGVGALMNSRVSRAAVKRAITNKHFDVVQWLVSHRENDLEAELDEELREAIVACLESEMDGFMPTGCVYVLPPV